MTESHSAETDRNFVNVIWEGALELPAGRDKGQKIEVTFSYDKNQVMYCSFLDVESNKKTEIDLNKGRYEEDGEELDIDQFLVD